MPRFVTSNWYSSSLAWEENLKATLQNYRDSLVHYFKHRKQRDRCWDVEHILELHRKERLLGDISYEKLSHIHVPEAETSPASLEDLSRNMKSQEQSPLFSKFPPEIRCMIFEYVLEEQSSKQSVPDMALYVSGILYCPVFDVALLCTCKRAYFEAKDLFVRNMSQLYIFRESSQWEPRFRPAPVSSHPMNMLCK
jgi:hypothetical protein